MDEDIAEDIEDAEVKTAVEEIENVVVDMVEADVVVEEVKVKEEEVAIS